MSEYGFMALGGTNVGASCYLYELGNTRLLIDCGVQPGLLGQASLPKLELLKDHRPDALVITHAHSDHLGALAVIKLLLPNLPVYTSEATARIGLPMLLDAARVAQRNGSPMFTEADVVKALQQVTTFTPNVAFEVGEIKLIPRVSGHIVGAVGLMLEHQSGFKVWHTADFNTVATPTTDAAYLPPVPEPVDVVVTETTYGNLELPSRKKQNGDFIAQVKKVLAGDGRVLVPTFALGRAQDVLLTLTRQLPGVPVYLDGLTRELTKLFAAMPEHLPLGVRNQLENGTNPFFPTDVHLVEDRRMREGVIHEQKPAVILASSGMLSQGVSPVYARQILQEPKSAVLIVGYQDAESAGRRLLEGRDEITLNGEAVTVSSHIERFYLSAHADRLGISQHLSRYPSKQLVLTHGEGGAREAIFALFEKEQHVDRPKVGVWLDLSGELLKRRKRAPHPTVSKQGSVRVRRYKTEITIAHDGDRLVLELPENFDRTLIPEGRYRLEAQMAAIASFKLVEQPERHVENPQQVDLPSWSENDKTVRISETGLETVSVAPEQRLEIPEPEPLERYIRGFKALQAAVNAKARTEIVARHPELLKALTVLCEKEAQVLELTCWQGMTYEAAGVMLELSGSRVGQLYKRTLRKLIYACEWRQARGAQTFLTETPTAAQIVQRFTDAVTAEDRLETAKQHPELRPPHACLTKEEDTVLELVFWQGLDYNQAAGQTGFPVSKISRLRHKSVEKLTDYAEQGGTFQKTDNREELPQNP